MSQISKWTKLNNQYIDTGFIYEVKFTKKPLFSDITQYVPEIIIMLPNSEIHFEPEKYHQWVKENNLDLPTFEDRL